MVALLTEGKNSRMRMKVQGCLIQAKSTRFSQKKVGYFSNRSFHRVLSSPAMSTDVSKVSHFFLLFNFFYHFTFPPGGLPVKILKALLASFILATWPAHLSLLDLITLTILGERYKL